MGFMAPIKRAVFCCLLLSLTGLMASAASAFASPSSFLAATSTLSMFAQAITRNPQLQQLLTSSNAAVTVFAPTDKAWQAIASATVGMNETIRQQLLEFHIADSVVDATNLQDGKKVDTLAEIPVTMDLKMRAGSTVVHGKYSLATVLSSHRAGKSIVHVIDTVLLPFPLDSVADPSLSSATETLSIFSGFLQRLPSFLRLAGGEVSRMNTPSAAKLDVLVRGTQPAVSAATPTVNTADDVIPPSPFTPDVKKCNVVGTPIEVFGFPSSPVAISPFKKEFRNPAVVYPKKRVCRIDGHCMNVYEIDAIEKDMDLGCPKLTTMVTFHGQVPGPTFMVPVGEESLIRLNNKLAGGVLTSVGEGQCEAGGERGEGLPLSLHNHGQPTLAAWDGWADNQMCPGETKDYLYCNNRPNTGWYHDHALALTAKHVYKGLAGFYIPTTKLGHGVNCGEPWNLDQLPDFHFMIGDKRFDEKCQLAIDLAGVDTDNFYGDINVVSGIPWPAMTVHPTSVRLRLLNAALSRPYKIFLADSKGKNIGAAAEAAGKGSVCKIVAGDGGFLQKPADMPTDGIFMGVAERYELVCDLRGHAGETLYLWNDDDETRSSGNVPFFCYSHLLVQIKVLSSCPAICDLPKYPLPLSPSGDDVLCGGGCYKREKGSTKPCTSAPATDKQFACCPTGQFCMRQNATHHVCKASAQPAPTCWQAGQPEDTEWGPRCGGRCYKDELCQGSPEAKACCPTGQYCWAADENNFFCRDNPSKAPADAEPQPPTFCSLPQPQYPATPMATSLDPLISEADKEAAMKMVEAGTAHRYMTFDKSGGLWSINGQSWNDFKIAANRIGQGTWEVWRLTVNGGWYHPVHIHLVDFWILSRTAPMNKVLPYEQSAPKDVVSLAPGEQAYILVRWGPHRGDYMFHCHNLVHEDRLMLRAFEVDTPENGLTAATAQQGNQSTTDYMGLSAATATVYDEYLAKDPMSVLPTATPDTLDVPYIQTVVDANNYRIFYPLPDDDGILQDRATNPWRVINYRDSDTCGAVPIKPTPGQNVANGDVTGR